MEEEEYNEYLKEKAKFHKTNKKIEDEMYQEAREHIGDGYVPDVYETLTSIFRSYYEVGIKVGKRKRKKQ